MRKGQLRYSPELRAFIAENYYGTSTKALIDLIETQFGIKLTEGQLRQYGHRHGLKTGNTGKFGTRPAWNKGLSNPHGPTKVSPEGSLIFSSGRYHIKHGDKWVEYSRYLWEQAHGPIPEGHIIEYRDRNSRNCVLENLRMVDKETHFEYFRRRDLRSNDPDLNDAAINIIKLEKLIKQRTNNG